MRKLISIITVICLISSIMWTLPIHSYSASSRFDDNYDLLYNLGIISDQDIFLEEESLSAQSVQRGTFLEFVCSMLGASDIEDKFLFATESGLVEGYGRQDYGWDDYITFEQAVKILVTALGHDVKADSKGGFPMGYLSVASEIGLLRGVSSSSARPLTFEEVAGLLCNALEVDIYKQVIFGDKISYQSQKNVNMLCEYLDIQKFEGILSADYYTSLTGESTLSKGTVRIGENILLKGDSDIGKYLGHNLVCYASIDDSLDYPLVLHTVPREDRNEVTVVNADEINISKTTRSEVYYYENRRTERKVSVSPVADMIYNGMAHPGFVKEDFDMQSGSVTFIDNNTDGVYDVIILNSYETMVTESVNSAFVIYNRYKNGAKTLRSIDLEEYDHVMILSGEDEVELDFIQKWNVLSVARSKNDKIVTIRISDEFMEGQIEAMDTTENLVVIDGEEYKLSNALLYAFENNDAKRFEVGQRSTFYLDIDGKIAAADKNYNSYSYAYLFKAQFSPGIDATLKLLMLDDEENWLTCEMEDRVLLNGVKMESSAAFGQIAQGNVIRYKINSAGRVYELETAIEHDGYDEAILMNNTFTKTSRMFKVYRTQNRSFNSEIYMDDNTVIFLKPTGTDSSGASAEEMQEYYALGQTNTFRADDSYTIIAYDVDKNNIAKAVVAEQEYKSSASVEDNSLFMVEKVTSIIMGEESLQRLYGVVANQNVQLNGVDSKIFGGINPGDIVQVHLNGNGRVDFAEVRQSIANGVVFSTLTNDIHQRRLMVTGLVFSIDKDAKSIKVQDADTLRTFRIDSAGLGFALYENDKANKATIDDIQVGDFVVMRIRHSLVSDLHIIRF